MPIRPSINCVQGLFETLGVVVQDVKHLTALNNSTIAIHRPELCSLFYLLNLYKVVDISAFTSYYRGSPE